MLSATIWTATNSNFGINQIHKNWSSLKSWPKLIVLGMFTFIDNFLYHFSYFFPIQSGRVLSHKIWEYQMSQQIIFSIMEVGEIVPNWNFAFSLCKFVHLLRFFVSDGIPQLTNFYPFSVVEPTNIFISFSFTSNCYFGKFLSVSFTNFFLSKVGTFECYWWMVKHTARNISIAVYFNDTTDSKFLSLAMSTYRSSLISATLVGNFSVWLLKCCSIVSLNKKQVL